MLPLNPLTYNIRFAWSGLDPQSPMTNPGIRRRSAGTFSCPSVRIVSALNAGQFGF
jgi:hypothetical protein